MNLIIEAPRTKTIEAHALKALLEDHLKGFPVFADTLVVVREPYQIQPSPDWEEVEPSLFTRKTDAT